ncbi:glycosyl transferase [Marinobacter goseongensis]|uniref:glycosyl transferase n=1 Tax=Marinobacter goseongensis TaxID=453838 RepID=UPI00200530CF|nr:glycosyl transferase [Marinobacter goseongensis]MCK7551577.1 glycosyl transferase [Marinobacter goseongensis]
MKLVYLSPVPWSSFSQRPQKFVQWFHKRTGGEVLWIEPYPTRFPVAADFGRLRADSVSQCSKLPTWIHIARPRSLPIEPLPGSGAVNRLLWSDVLEQVEEFGREKNILIVVGKPSVLALQVLSKFPGVRSFYDAMDDFPAFYAGLSQIAMRKRERLVAEQTGELFVSSSALKERWSRLDKKVTLVPNGLDKNILPEGVRARQRRGGRAIFGYVGTIGAWFDWEWIDTLATCRPNDEIRLIGPVFQSAPVNLSNNITFHPPCSHRDALEAMSCFDVGLIPFKRNQLTSSVDPIKFYEYRALQLPILSTKFGEMGFRQREPGTYLTETKQDIELMAEAALNHTYVEGSGSFLRDNCWEARFEASGILGN